MIKKGSSAYYEQLFETNTRMMKPFSFATYIKDIEVDDAKINGEALHVTVSSPSYELIMYLMNGSEKNKTYYYKNFSFTLKKKVLLPKPPTFTDNILFKTLSPLLIETKEKTPLLSTHDAFEKELNYYANLLLTEIYHRSLKQPLTIVDSAMKKVVIKENLHQKEKHPIYLTGNQGLIQLKGHREDLQAIYESGIGRRRSLGFGLLEVEGVN